MTEYIRRKDAAKLLGHIFGVDVVRRLHEVPAADVAEVVHGHWRDNGIAGSVLVKCTVCGFDCGASSFFYCPACGAKMDGGGNEAKSV